MRRLGRVGRERSEDPHRAQLQRVAEPGDLAASSIGLLEVVGAEHKEAGQLLRVPPPVTMSVIGAVRGRYSGAPTD